MLESRQLGCTLIGSSSDMTKVAHAAYILVFFGWSIGLNCGWLLAQVGLNETYRVHHLSIHFVRVFISINVESQRFPTLIESQWPETYLSMRTVVFPYSEAHANGDHRDCSKIHQTLWTQVDSLSRLWVLDKGWAGGGAKCPPKLLVYDLLRNNVEVLRIDCGKYMAPGAEQLLVVKLGKKPTPCGTERFIYFALANDPYLLAYDTLEQQWHQRHLLSKKYINVSESFPLHPMDIAFGDNGELLVSDADGVLYSSSVALKPSESDEPIELDLLGSLLGPSRGMMVNHLGALFYVVIKFGAVVRCNYTFKQNISAENNEIIYMTSKNIQQIFFGNDGTSVWLMTDRILKPEDHCFPGI